MPGPNIPYTKLDIAQVLKNVYEQDKDILRIMGIGGTLVPEEYDNIALTYVASGPGAGEVETVTYTLEGDTVAVLTLTYNPSSQLINVARS